jgi:hypothetical protein
MRIVALEEHFNLPDLVAGIPAESIAAWGWPAQFPPHMRRDEALADLGAGRLADMDAAGVTVQVLSTVGPGADLLQGQAAVAFARATNDRLAAAVGRRPDRLAGFAHLPLSEPSAAADELERAVTELGFRGAMVHGMAMGRRFLDHPSFEPLLARAEALNAPLYMHPGLPPPAVREAYFQDLPEHVGFQLATAGWGWHAETALHVLRLVLNGVLDRHRGLKLIVGHMGEGLPAMMARVDKVFTPMTSAYLSRTITGALLDQLWITTSGFFDLPSFMAGLLTFGPDRILFSVDYPFAPNAVARPYLEGLPLSPADRAKIAHGNADALLGLTPAAG